MESGLIIAPSSISSVFPSRSHLRKNSIFRRDIGDGLRRKDCALAMRVAGRNDAHKYMPRCCLEPHLGYSEITEKSVGPSEKYVGEILYCPSCQAKGAVICPACSGSGLYADLFTAELLEEQGIIVSLSCLNCGGTGHVICSQCDGRCVI